MKKVFISILAVLVLLVTLVPAAAFALTTGESTGSFTVGNADPVVGDITISPDSMTPQEEWTVITVPVTDVNTFADVKEVKVTVFYDSDGSHPAAPGSADVQTCAILTWTRAGGFLAIDPAGTTWAINSPGCSKPADSASTGDWVFSFKVGKVATETIGSADWDIYAVATDTALATGDNRLNGVVMNWYGDITVNTPSVNWGSVTPGTGFADGVNEQGGISVKYIANGDYAQKVKSGATWIGITQTATFDEGGSCATANKFSLEAYTSDTFGSAVQVTLAGATIDNAGIQTLEAGNTVATNDLWLKLASVFTIDTYSGTITYVVANR